jgi:DNA-binding response OmpR family regulator
MAPGSRGAWTERVEGIDAGADDYLPQPFYMEELYPAWLRASATPRLRQCNAGSTTS